MHFKSTSNHQQFEIVFFSFFNTTHFTNITLTMFVAFRASCWLYAVLKIRIAAMLQGSAENMKNNIT